MLVYVTELEVVVGGWCRQCLYQFSAHPGIEPTPWGSPTTWTRYLTLGPCTCSLIMECSRLHFTQSQHSWDSNLPTWWTHNSLPDFSLSDCQSYKIIVVLRKYICDTVKCRVWERLVDKNLQFWYCFIVYRYLYYC